MKPLDNIGEHMTIEEFADCVRSGIFIDYDGFGHYATETEQSDFIIRPSDVKFGKKLREGFTHVMWYNR